MKREFVQKSFLEKLDSLRKLLLSRFWWLEGQDLCRVMGRLAHFHYSREKYLVIGNEKALYDFLIESSYNPFTVYRWLLLERVPEDIRFQVRQGRMSQKLAVSESLKRRHERQGVASQLIREHGLSLIARM